MEQITKPSLRPWDYGAISAYAFALSVLWNGLGPIILPVKILGLVPESLKNTYLSLLTFLGLALATVVQPVVGTLSDGFSSRWGRRRPFILGGALGSVVFLGVIAQAGDFSGLLASYLGLQFLSNVAQGPYQAFIPDLVPENRRGVASGLKNLAEILGVILCSKVIAWMMDQYLRSQGPLWMELGTSSIALVLILALVITLFWVKEKPGPFFWAWGRWPQAVRETFRLSWQHDAPYLWFLASRFFILAAMTAVQTFAFYFIKDRLQLPNPAAVTGDLLVITGLCVLLTVYPAGYLSDRIGRKPLLFFSGIMGGVGVFLMTFAASYWDVLLYGGLMGLSIGVFLSTNWALATDLAPPEEAGRYLGLSNLATAGGGAAARLAGPGIDFFNARAPGLGYSILFLTCATYFALGTALLLKVKAPERRPLS